MEDLIKTQHFTKQYEKILKNIDFHPKEAVDPFAGELIILLKQNGLFMI